MWGIGCSDLHDQLDAVFENAAGLAAALERMTTLKARDPGKHVWARGESYDIVTRCGEGGDIGFLVCPTTDSDSEPPATCLPWQAAELLELAFSGVEMQPAEDHCSMCGEVRRGRYANRDAGFRPLFLCSACDRWSETLPNVPHPGRRLRVSGLGD